jgi:hypothetical protein
LQELGAVIVSAMRRVYDGNAGRYDDLVGDDTITFAMCVYRNSWFQLEQELNSRDDWRASRPDGSLCISGYGYDIHVYRHGQNERVNLEDFRLDDAGISATKRHISETNGQLMFAFEKVPEVLRSVTDLRSLVVAHAGNPDDGCCGVWIGAPVPAKEITISPWAWIEPLWIIDRVMPPARAPRETLQPTRHDELPEPDVEVKPVEDDESSTGRE